MVKGQLVHDDPLPCMHAQASWHADHSYHHLADSSDADAVDADPCQHLHHAPVHHQDADDPIVQSAHDEINQTPIGTVSVQSAETGAPDDAGHEGNNDGADDVEIQAVVADAAVDQVGHAVESAHENGAHVQITVKIGDHTVSGGARYRAWIDHREAVLQRLRGWELVTATSDFATFYVPQGIVQAAAAERAANVSKVDRKFWGDKNDFCRCLEAVMREVEHGRQQLSDPRNCLPMPEEPVVEHGVGFQRHVRPRQSETLSMLSRGVMPFAPGADSVDTLLRMLECRDSAELVGYDRRLRVLCNKIDLHVQAGGAKGDREYPSALLELPLPPSAAQEIKQSRAKIQRSMLPTRLSIQVDEMQQRLLDLLDSLQQGRVDPKALGHRSNHDRNPAHVSALLKTGLALMGKEGVEDPMEHWICVPRPRLVQIYVDEFNRFMKSVSDQAQQHAHMDPIGPMAKYVRSEASSYVMPGSKERLGDRILHALNVIVVPIVDRTCSPLKVTKGVMSNPVGMPDDYLVRYLDIFYKHIAKLERDNAGASLLGDAVEYETLRATLPKDALPLIEAIICTYGGEEERMRLGIPIRRKTASFERVKKARQDLELLAKSADAHVATSGSKAPHSAREYHIRAKAKQLGIWLDPSKRTTATDRRRPTDEHEGLAAFGSDPWESEDVTMGTLGFMTQGAGGMGGGHQAFGGGDARGRPMNAIPIHRLAGLGFGDASGRQSVDEVEARIQSDPRGPVQVQVKIGDHEQNGNFRYKAWVMHRDLVMQRLRWEIVEHHDDLVTFNVPAAMAEAADAERKAKISKEDRRFFGDKIDFCRCLEVVMNEVRGIRQRSARPASLAPEMLQARQQMIATTEYKIKLSKLREQQAELQEGSATAERIRQEEERLSAKHMLDLEQINLKYGSALCSNKRKRSTTASHKLPKRAKGIDKDVAQLDGHLLGPMRSPMNMSLNSSHPGNFCGLAHAKYLSLIQS